MTQNIMIILKKKVKQNISSVSNSPIFSVKFENLTASQSHIHLIPSHPKIQILICQKQDLCETLYIPFCAA